MHVGETLRRDYPRLYGSRRVQCKYLLSDWEGRGSRWRPTISGTSIGLARCLWGRALLRYSPSNRVTFRCGRRGFYENAKSPGVLGPSGLFFMGRFGSARFGAGLVSLYQRCSTTNYRTVDIATICPMAQRFVKLSREIRDKGMRDRRHSVIKFSGSSVSKNLRSSAGVLIGGIAVQSWQLRYPSGEEPPDTLLIASLDTL